MFAFCFFLCDGTALAVISTCTIIAKEEKGIERWILSCKFIVISVHSNVISVIIYI